MSLSPSQQSSSISSLNFRLIIRCNRIEQYLNIPSFEEISNLYKIGLKKAYLKDSDVVACINVQRLKVLRINGKLRDQINNGDTIWYVTLTDWEAYNKILSKDAPIRHGKKLTYPNPKSLPQQNLWELIQSNYFTSTDDTEDEVQKTILSHPNNDNLNSQNINNDNIIERNITPKSAESEIDEQQPRSSSSSRYGKPEIVSRKLKKIIISTKVIPYKHRPRARLTKTALHYHNKQNHSKDGNDNKDNENNERDNQDNEDNQDDDNNKDLESVDINNDINDIDYTNINANDNNNDDVQSNTFSKSKLTILKKKILNSPSARAAHSDNNVINTDVVDESDSPIMKVESIIMNTVTNYPNNIQDIDINDDSSDDDEYNDSHDAVSKREDDNHNFSESLEKSYLEELPAVNNDDVGDEPNDTDEKEDIPIVKIPESSESFLLKEQADELEEERRVRAMLEARLQESRIMLQILAGQNLITHQRRKSNNDIDVLEKTIEGVGEVLSVPADSPISKIPAENQKSSNSKTNSTPVKVITSVRRAYNNSTPVISISLSHLLDDPPPAESAPETNDDHNKNSMTVVGADQELIEIENNRKTVANNANTSPTTSEKNDEIASMASEKPKSSIFNSLLSVFQKKKVEDSGQANKADRLENGPLQDESDNDDFIEANENEEIIADDGETDTAVLNHNNDKSYDNNNNGSDEQIINHQSEDVIADPTTEIDNGLPELHSKTPAGKLPNNLNVDTNHFLSPIECNISLAFTPGTTPSQFRDISLDELGLTLDNSNKSFKTSDLLQLLALDPNILRKYLLLGKSLPEILSMSTVNSDSQEDRKLHDDDDIGKPSKVESYYLPFYITLKSQELRKSPFQLRLSHEDVSLFTLFQLYGKMEGGILVSQIRLSSITKALQDVKIIGASLLSDKKIEALVRKIPYTANNPSVDGGSTIISPMSGKASSSKKVMSINGNALQSPHFSKQYSFDQFKHILRAIIPIIIKTANNNRDDSADVDLQIYETIKLSIKLWLLSSSAVSNSTYKQFLDNSKVCLSGSIRCIGNPMTPITKTINANGISSSKKSIKIDVSNGENDIQLWGCNVNLEEIKGTRSLWDKNMEQLKNIFIGYATCTLGPSSSSATSPIPSNDGANRTIMKYLSFDDCREMLMDFGIIPDILDQQAFAKIFRSTKLWEWYIVASIGIRRNNQDDNTIAGDDSKNRSRKKMLNLNDFLLLEQQQHSIGSQHNQMQYYLPNLTNYNDIENDISSCFGSFHLTFLGLVELLTRIASYGGRLGSSPCMAVENLLRVMNGSNGKHKLANSRKRRVLLKLFVI